MNLMIAFVLAFASVLFNAAISRFVAGYFADDRASRIAGFSVAIGYALARYSSSGPVRVERLPDICAFLGAVAALVAAWAWLLRKRAVELTDADS